VLISKIGITEWNGTTKKWYEERGYIFTNWGDKFEVKIDDLLNNSRVKVDVECDGCGELLEGIIWRNYKKSVKDDGKYYCHKCTMQLFGGEKTRKTKLKDSITFYQWCYDNLPKEFADWILDRWDDELNIDKNGNKLSPKDVSHSSRGLNGKGYWFKCLKHPEHGSELKNISSFTNVCSGVNLDCIKCNSIFTTHPHLVKYLVNPEDALKYPAGSSKIKLPMRCPDCGYEKKREISQLRINGFSCPKCSDNIPYPEKFTFNVLEQLLNKDFITQLNKSAFKWCRKYRYDFYIKKINGICEVGGLQHYEEVGINWGSLEDIQNNDFDKEWLARSNNIKNYIIIDCRKSELEWIKNSIMKSKLPKLLNFKEEDIDWLKAHEYACSNIIKLVCNMWDDGTDNISKVSKKFKLHSATIRKYLKQGAKLNWCDYDPNKELQKSKEKLKNKLSIKVMCLTTGEIFNSIKDAKRKYGIQDSGISQCCYNKQKYCGKHPVTKELLKWIFYDEYLIKNQTIGWYDEYIKNHNYNKKVTCLTTGEVFDSQTEASSKYNIRRQNISKCCNNKRQSMGKHPITEEPLRWMFYNEYINTIETREEVLTIG